ncbi:MAG: DUF2085 domain-containing protein [Candidatus Mycalebacterium zealandia]|nr:MAG: DUF2085 domain-containing protein [Candidatus Mycalebacterium zealandia]
MIMRLLIFATFFLLALFSLMAPIRQSISGFPNGESIYLWLSFICHQLPSKSFWILGFPCGLCSRCLLGYTGIAVAALFVSSPQKYTNRALLGIALLLPAILDVFAQSITNYQSINLIRSVTGFLGGAGVFMLCFPSKFEKSLVHTGGLK